MYQKLKICTYMDLFSKYGFICKIKYAQIKKFLQILTFLCLRSLNL